MLKDIKSLENYIQQNFSKGVTMTDEYIEFLKTKVQNIKSEFVKLDKRVLDADERVRQKTAEAQQRISRAEEREKAQIERQKEFGVSQTKVEEARHKNIMEELDFLAKKGIKVYNRSSYPFFPRHKQQKFKKK